MEQVIGRPLKRGEMGEIADFTGRERTHVLRVLRGERQPGRELAESIARYFDIPVERLFPELNEEASNGDSNGDSNGTT